PTPPRSTLFPYTTLFRSLALVFYTILVLGGLAALDATLTAPGIAGLILSIGMAVDANVLIFERIREELAAGRTARAAVDAGFKQDRKSTRLNSSHVKISY